MLELTSIVDMENNFCGKTVEGIPILHPDEQDDDCKAIIITNSLYGYEIRKYLRDKGRYGAKIIDLDCYVTREQPWSKCIFTT